MSDLENQEPSRGLSLQAKFVLAVLLVVAMAVIPITFSSSQQVRATSRRALEYAAHTNLELLEGMVLTEDGQGFSATETGRSQSRRRRLSRIMTILTNFPGVLFVSLREADGTELLTVYDQDASAEFLRSKVLAKVSDPEHTWTEPRATVLEHARGTTRVLRQEILTEGESGSPRKVHELWLGVAPEVQQFEITGSFERSLGLVMIISILVISVALFVFTREFLRPIRGLLFGANRLAEGDLEYQVMIDSQDELGRLADAFNSLSRTIRTRLAEQRELVSQVERIVRRLGNSTSAILSVVSQQVSGAGQQASSVHHVSSTAEEIAASSRSVAETAKTMGQAANETVYACEHGKTEVDEAISGIRAARETVTGIASSMERLGADSRKIGEILKLIEGISEQTNLLALNAAIEAAGAGEAGQRFAIVATEVKRLATRTNESTKEIRDLISTIQNSTNKAIMLTEEGTRAVAEGYERVHRVGDSIQEIRDSVERTSMAADAILASSQEQVTATEKMAESMNEIRKVADAILENSSVTEATVEEINEICSQLRELFEHA